MNDLRFEERHGYARLITYIDRDFRELHFAITINTLDFFRVIAPLRTCILPKLDAECEQSSVELIGRRACQQNACTTLVFRKFPMIGSHKYPQEKASSGYPTMNNPKPK
jgi:hypothetical protein